MADPTKYLPGYAFTAAPSFFPASQLNNELAQVSSSTNETIDALKDIRRSDGKLQNKIVDADALADGLRIQGDEGPEGPQGVQGPFGPQGATGAVGPQGATGPAGAQGVAGVKGSTGSQGVQGPIGATGAKGDQGLTGATGSTGSQGIVGPAGPTGAKGDTGLTGAKGDTGAQGIVGPAGPTGSTGERGFTGATGATGTQGVAGPAGATGPAGEQGPAGATGAAGPQGIAGPQGVRGIIGPGGATGATGAPGATGERGAQGKQGAGVSILGTLASEADLPPVGQPGDAYLIDGDLFVWDGSAWQNVGNLEGPPGPIGATGAQGPQGPQGAVGLQGATGAQGLQGAVGPVGPQGVKGDTGLTGAKGDTGAQGTAGATGSQGVKGDTGLTGAKGDTGAQGAVGPAGIQGVKGDTGGAGAKGDTGAQGAVGPAGPNGLQGETGLQGPTGATGPKGDTGSQGPIGLTGATGPQGLTGATGAQGATGATGPQGPQGIQGLVGPAGAIGPKGDTGAQGPQGEQSTADIARFVGSDPAAERATNYNVADSQTFGTFSANGTITRMNYHGFEDWTTINASEGNLGYCSFDAKPRLFGTLAQDHFAFVQARGEYYGSGNITNYWDCINTLPGHFGTGTVQTMRGLNVRNPAGTGPIVDLVGIRIEPQTRGSNNFQIFSEGTAPSYFAGRIGIGKQALASRPLDVRGVDGGGIGFSTPTVDMVMGVASSIALLGTTTAQPTSLLVSGVRRLTAFTNGNIAIGSTVDSGAKLNVTGSALISGNVGFNGAQPQARVALPANATDAASSYALVNAIKTLLINVGLAS